MFRRKLPQRVIVHSDRGSQYCSSAYQDLIKRYNLQCSMSAKGCCYDNAAVESFFHTIKVELINDMRYQTREIAKSSIVEYIECYYNRKRRHSTIAYNIPVLFEQNLLSIA